MARILLLEPDLRLGRIYKHALESVDHVVDHCRMGQAAVLAADQVTPDIVILELQLARHNGIEFLYEFRSYPEWQNVPVIVHSLVPSTEAGMESLFTGGLSIAAYHYKPLTKLRDLLSTVERLLVPVA